MSCPVYCICISCENVLACTSHGFLTCPSSLLLVCICCSIYSIALYAGQPSVGVISDDDHSPVAFLAPSHLQHHPLCFALLFFLPHCLLTTQTSKRLLLSHSFSCLHR
jgi:hypothetical protein